MEMPIRPLPWAIAGPVAKSAPAATEVTKKFLRVNIFSSHYAALLRYKISGQFHPEALLLGYWLAPCNPYLYDNLA
jgi:hypothetical protein